ncbi:MAG: KUP/HAK/KT family potassium transporter [Bacteroidales bacterium]
MISILGLIQVFHFPAILQAFNPYYAVQLISSHPHSLLLLGRYSQVPPVPKLFIATWVIAASGILW